MAVICKLPRKVMGGNISKILTVHGGSNETITVSGDISDSFTLNSDGISTYVLVAKQDSIVTFTGGLSGYIRRLALTDAENEDVYVMPQNALFWYGNKSCESNSGGWSNPAIKTGSNSYIADMRFNTANITTFTRQVNTNSLELNTVGFWSGTNTLPPTIASFYTKQKLVLQNYTKINLKINVKTLSLSGVAANLQCSFGTSSFASGQYVTTWSNTAARIAMSSLALGQQDVSLNLPSSIISSTGYYLDVNSCIKFNGTASFSCDIEIQAVWLE